MFKDIKSHISHYLVLLVVLAIGLESFWLFSFNKTTQTLIVSATAFSYFCWGVVHHYLENNLNLKIVIEYALIAVLGIVAFLTLLQGGI